MAANRNDQSDGEASSAELPPVIVPPYWQHRRAASRTSIISNGRIQPIRLEDNSQEPEGVTSPLWARVVAVDSYTIVSGSVKGVGDYVVWICRVDTLGVCASTKMDDARS